ncbi:5'-methylthioadenosine/adenosylhomocysteine nucleosidase [Gabonibacter chumensis]|uniref:5'-methylthioadenosine/adenosylhomocysteine nucleosidase n=1 Tax=Gabonibacter chumensis TaxID=2972474 RepID=UPI0025726C5D|nr:5'-methylthioadenosine/adenosylhomocysteine nucleosidase [Gabonibacter chumensis]MCR9011785.1 5'-methylthioadenosine/adenosylhomocysteine nucleosidase [Gabonibacter chumensis]
MKTIGVIVAMSSEYELVRSLLTGKQEKEHHGICFLEGQVEGCRVVLVKSGIGKVCSAVGTVLLIRDYVPDVIINTGVAGGIDPLTRVMDIVVGKQMVYHDVWCGEGNEYGQVQGLPSRFVSDEELYRVALDIPHEGQVYGGLICSGDQFITDQAALAKIKKRFPEGLAVDMESSSIAQVCYLMDIPFLSYRIISDTPGVENHSGQYRNFWEEAPKRSFLILKELIARVGKMKARI